MFSQVSAAAPWTGAPHGRGSARPLNSCSTGKYDYPAAVDCGGSKEYLYKGFEHSA